MSEELGVRSEKLWVRSEKLPTGERSSLLTHKKNDVNNYKGFLIIPNNIEVLKSNFIDKKDSKIYLFEPREFVVEYE